MEAGRQVEVAAGIDPGDDMEEELFMNVRKLGAITASALFLFSACTSGASPTPSATSTSGASAAPSGSAAASAAPGGTVSIWSSLPRQGSSKGQTDTIVNSIKLALEKKGGAVAGWTINYVDQDDSTAEAGQWTPEKETDNATKAVATNDLVAYIGTFNSGAAKISIPILCKAGIPMVSPANTYPGLTKAENVEPGEPDKYYADCKDGKKNYFRVVPADDLQGKVAADWAKELGVTKVYVIDDSQIYGKGVADVFDASAEAAGLEVLAHDQITGKETDYKALAQSIKSAAPDLVYFGGITQQNAGQLWKDIRAALPDVKMMGPDGISEQAFLDAAGSAAEGSYITFGGLSPSEYTDSAAEFRDEYKAKYGGELESYTIYGYEAANVVLTAIETAIEGGASDAAAIRAGTLDALRATQDYEGVLGTWSFDANGDTSLTTFSGQIVKSGKIEFEKVLGQ
jgi:branched-chain amino acid transport system substrate-binding protein